MTPSADSDAVDGMLEGPFGAREWRDLCAHGRFDTLSLTKQLVLTAEIAKELSALESLQSFWLWCAVTRTAMRHVISIPGLEALDVLKIRYPGAHENLVEATELRRFRCDFLSEDDLLAISHAPNLQDLGAQNADISLKTIDAIIGIPNLRKLDIEATELDDEMAAALAASSTIDSLDIGASRVTAEGLRSICAMSQLRSLDIWALDIHENDLDLLQDLPILEYLSVGGYFDQTRLTSKGVLPRLAALPSLKRIWLDGIVLSGDEKTTLEERYEVVRN